MKTKTRLISFMAILTVLTGIFMHLSTVSDVKGEVTTEYKSQREIKSNVPVPKSIKANTIDYKIELARKVFYNSDVPAWGLTIYDSSLIRMRDDIPVDRQQQVIIHEFMHALLYETNGQSLVKDEEQFCGWVSKDLLPALRDNPELLDFLLQETK